jgi:hypothetical protein
MATVDSIDLLVSFDSNEGCAQALEEALKQLREDSLSDEGCVHHRLAKSELPLLKFFLQERWRDAQALQISQVPSSLFIWFRKDSMLEFGDRDSSPGMDRRAIKEI